MEHRCACDRILDALRAMLGVVVTAFIAISVAGIFAFATAPNLGWGLGLGGGACMVAAFVLGHRRRGRESGVEHTR